MDISAETISSMAVYTPDGVTVARNDNGAIDTDMLTPGLYIVATRYDNGTTSIRKVVIR